jgi:hypothetical protein
VLAGVVAGAGAGAGGGAGKCLIFHFSPLRTSPHVQVGARAAFVSPEVANCQQGPLNQCPAERYLNISRVTQMLDTNERCRALDFQFIFIFQLST